MEIPLEDQSDLQEHADYEVGKQYYYSGGESGGGVGNFVYYSKGGPKVGNMLYLPVGSPVIILSPPDGTDLVTVLVPALLGDEPVKLENEKIKGNFSLDRRTGEKLTSARVEDIIRGGNHRASDTVPDVLLQHRKAVDAVALLNLEKYFTGELINIVERYLRMVNGIRGGGVMVTEDDVRCLYEIFFEAVEGPDVVNYVRQQSLCDIKVGCDLQQLTGLEDEPAILLLLNSGLKTLPDED